MKPRSWGLGTDMPGSLAQIRPETISKAQLIICAHAEVNPLHIDFRCGSLISDRVEQDS